MYNITCLICCVDYNKKKAGQILHLDVMSSNILWLMDIPAGMKLNKRLDYCLGSMVLFGIDYWDYLTTIVTQYEPMIVMFISVMGIFGASMVIKKKWIRHPHTLCRETTISFNKKKN